MNYDELINFRWGSEPQGKIKRKSLSKKWMFIKPDVGNLSAAPQMPFCSFNVVPYFGGYPSGFSLYEYCAWGTPRKTGNKDLMGFTHFSFSGSGDLHHFHNYFLIKPSENKQPVIKEKFSLNGLEIETPSYKISAIVNSRSIYYKINSNEDIVMIPGFNGLTTEKYKSNIIKADIYKVNNKLINIYANYSFVHLFWSLKIIKGNIVKLTDTKIILSKNTEFILAFSVESFKEADVQTTIFDDKLAITTWEKYFNIFDIKGDDYYKKLFFTSLMFALKKPYIYDKDSIYDFATMWDVYKTLLPLIFLFYKEEASIITNNMLKLVNEDGLFYHANLFSVHKPVLSDQAICLINISLSTAALYGVKFDKKKAMELQRREIEYYLRNISKLDRTTYILDLSDAIVAYYNAYGIDLGIEKVKLLFNNAFEQDKVYLNKKATYYEGNYSNYSFRTSASTIYRLENKEKIVLALDKFFGFKGRRTRRFSKPKNPVPIKLYMKHCKRFEGLNNEPDMESMYLYSYFNEYKKQNKVIKDVIENSFSLKNNGVPGNDDNGGLSSWLVFNLLGLFPIVGTNRIKIGLPFFDEVKVGKLIIQKHYDNVKQYEIDKVLFNEKHVQLNEITALDIAKGGKLDIFLK